MELILISDTKLKVMLSAEDMQRYHISCDTIDYDNPHSRRAFWNILDEAKSRTGFDPAGNKVFVQLYPSREGGCEMFVTKLGVRGALRGAGGAEYDPSALKRGTPDTAETMYAFLCMEDLLAASRRLMCEKYADVARAYVGEGIRRYYLSIPGGAPWMPEYNARVCTPEETSYIYEHGRCFCSDAAGKLGPLA